jgi:octaprenyl-diphosphate synthase
VARRGSPSTFERFGPNAALIAGDYLISRSIELISHYDPPVVNAFAKACMDMSEGEMMDLSSACSPDDYFQCISKKTASLFSTSAKIGSLISGASKDDLARFEEYGMNLGLGYQVLDDLEEFSGIDQGKSSKKTSVTLPIIYCHHHGEDAARNMCINLIDDYRSRAKRILCKSSGRKELLTRLESIVDEMTCQGLERCRSQKSLC